MSTLHEERVVGLPPAGGGLMRRLNIVTAAGGGLVLGVVGWAIARHFMVEKDFGPDQVTVITMVCWAVGFMAGIGAFNGPIGWLRGRDLSPEDELFLAGKDQGIRRYFRFTTDHKVVGIQYLVLTMVLFGVGGAMAMLIRTNLISPNSNFLSPQQYNAVVGLHGLIMIIATIIMVTGPFGNFTMPLMIGARDMAFPRLNALSLWMIVAAVPILLSAAFLGGIPTGWSGFAPLADRAPPGMDAFLMSIIIFAISSAVAGANITTTVLTMRARGMTWNRTPIFVYGVVASVGLAIPAFPMFMASQVLLGLDRTMGARFYIASGGGNPWLYANLFWLMGHPEVYVILIPAVAALMELTAVFSRKPLFSFIIGGITGLYLSDVPVDYALHGSMFITAHFHYTLMGAGLTGAIGALAYGSPKMTGRMLNERFGFISFWLVQIGFNGTFMGMFAVGLAGQPRRVYTYDNLLATGNFVSTMGAYAIGIGMLFLLYAVISSWRHGVLAPSNPWGSKTLEWTVPNPIPLENFEVLPVVTSDAYGYREEPFEPFEGAPRPHKLERAHVGGSADDDSTEGARP